MFVKRPRPLTNINGSTRKPQPATATSPIFWRGERKKERTLSLFSEGKMEDDERADDGSAGFDQQKRIEESLASPVTAFYEGASVLITGATGFIGKVLLEKLLRSCPGIIKIYILLRNKKGKDVEQRLHDILNSEAFDLIKEERASFLSKVVAIEGDISLEDVGLSNADVETVIENVSVVFHSAATIKFDEPLRTAVSMNLLGTKHIFDLARRMVNLKAFVHVSTAYSNCDREEIQEVVYPPPIAPQYILDTFQLMDSQFMDAMTPKLIRGRPNTYTLTKALAETYLAENAGDLPVAIVRPSTVTASWKEPLTGWVDSMAGITGVYFAVSTGLLRRAKMDKSVDADFIPVDIVTNLMISVAWYTSTSSSSSVPVYNCTSGTINNLKWKLVKDISVPFIMKNPSVRMFRVPKLQTTTSRFIHFLGCMINHYIPAFFFDATRVLQGKKPRMIQLYNKVHSVVGGLEYFALHSWKFGCENVISLYQKMAPKDQMCFNFNIQPLDWPVYIQNHIIGMQQFLMKEDESKLTLARKRLRSLYIKSVLLKILSLATFLWLVLRHSTRAWKLLSLFGALFRKLSFVVKLPIS